MKQKEEKKVIVIGAKQVTLVIALTISVLGVLISTIRINSIEKKLKDIEQCDQIETVNEETNQEETKQVDVTKQEEQTNQAQVEYDTIDDYIEIIFPTDGNYYVEATGTIKFYADKDCTIPISNPRFISKGSGYISMYLTESGYRVNVHVFLLEGNKVCYCPSSILGIDFVEED